MTFFSSTWVHDGEKWRLLHELLLVKPLSLLLSNRLHAHTIKYTEELNISHSNIGLISAPVCLKKRDANSVNILSFYDL